MTSSQTLVPLSILVVFAIYRPVKSNQQRIHCDCCYFWQHSKYLKMSDIEYLSLVQSDEPWCCPTCLKEAFPFHNCSDISFDLPHPNPLSPPDPQSPPAPPPAPPATPHPNQLCSIFYLNCRSLLPKLDALRVQAMSSNPSIIALVETWLDTSISSQEFSIPGYSCILRDRHRHGGGILL